MNQSAYRGRQAVINPNRVFAPIAIAQPTHEPSPEQPPAVAIEADAAAQTAGQETITPAPVMEQLELSNVIDPDTLELKTDQVAATLAVEGSLTPEEKEALVTGVQSLMTNPVLSGPELIQSLVNYARQQSEAGYNAVLDAIGDMDVQLYDHVVAALDAVTAE